MSGVVWDVFSNLYVVDYVNYVICKIVLGGVVMILVGMGSLGYVDGMVGSVKFVMFVGIVVVVSGNIYVMEFYGNDI